jgi:hypothetical protein
MHIRARSAHQLTTRLQQPGAWVAGLARLGYAAKGVVYAAIGLVATRAALGATRPTGYRGAVRELLKLPVGALLVGAVAAGLLGYAGWRLVRALANPEQESFRSRLYSFSTAVVHISVCFGVLGILLGSGGDAGDGAARQWTARAFAQPLGRWIVLAAALGFLAGAAWQFYKTVSARLDDELELGRMKRWLRKLTLGAARVGMLARALIFGLIGLSLLRAWQRFDAESAHGLPGALRELERARFGALLLFGVAAGLVAYSAYQFILARYRRVHI